MRLPTLFRTSVFQVTLIYMALFAVSVVTLFAFIYWSTIGFLERQTNALIETEIEGLYEQFSRRGLPGLAAVINERIDRDAEGRSIYILADAIGRSYAGNAVWPRGIEPAADWVDFTGVGENGEMPVRARVIAVGPGIRLLVGRDIRELARINQVFRRAYVYGLSLTLGFGLIGGVLLGLSARRRVAEINRTTRQIIAGDFTQRAPIGGSGDEHDELAANVNSMLDQIQALVENLRHVGDSVAHDLRGPLTRLRNRLETVASCERPSREDLNECVTQVEGVLATFDALLRIARVESGAHRSAFAPVRIDTVVHDVCELYQAAADERRIRLVCAAAPAVEVFGDRELLAQALTNLLDNAVKYTPNGGTIRVTLDRTADTATLSVADTGPGIPAADRERVLQRFTRLDQARSRPGNGLGLALVSAVAAQHHGTLTLGDHAPGLIVTLTLPALV